MSEAEELQKGLQYRLDEAQRLGITRINELLYGPRQKPLRERFLYWLWGYAEEANFAARRPRWFWWRLLRRLDQHHGHSFTYDEEGSKR